MNGYVFKSCVSALGVFALMPVSVASANKGPASTDLGGILSVYSGGNDTLRTELEDIQLDLTLLVETLRDESGGRRYRSIGQRYRSNKPVADGRFFEVATIAGYRVMLAKVDKALERVWYLRRSARKATKARQVASGSTGMTSRETSQARTLDRIEEDLTSFRDAMTDFKTRAAAANASRWDKEVYAPDARLIMLAAGISLKRAISLTTLRPGRSDGRIHRLEVHSRTGSDDLRGGQDNVNFAFLFRDRGTSRRFVFNNVNKSKRWANHSAQRIFLSLPEVIHLSRAVTVTGVEITTTSGGGVGGDNWNLEYFHVTARDDHDMPVAYCPAGSRRGVKYGGQRVFRFTGKSRRVFVKCFRVP